MTASTVRGCVFGAWSILRDAGDVPQIRADHPDAAMFLAELEDCYQVTKGDARHPRGEVDPAVIVEAWRARTQLTLFEVGA